MKKTVWLYVSLSFSLFLIVQPGYSDGLLESLPVMKNYKAGRVSSYDRTGFNHDFLSNTTGTVTLAEIEGPGAITHVWVTIASREKYHLRKLVLRMYWDGETSPSVESPIGDFFGLGHGTYYHFQSRPISIGTENGMNCFWFMPFEKSAKVTLTNEGDLPIKCFYYYIDYRTYDKGDAGVLAQMGNMGKFHAGYRQQMPTHISEDYEILSATGRGHYVGCNLSIELNQPGWWGEGDDKIYIDGDTSPTLNGTGSEDYFCGAWGYGDAFYSLYFGCPLRGKGAPGSLWNVYRYHLEDPIPFTRSINVTIEALHGGAETDPGNNYSSVAYWYQSEPHAPFAPLPPVNERLPRGGGERILEITGAIEAENLPLLSKSKDTICKAQDMSPFPDLWSKDKQLWFIGKKAGDNFTLGFDTDEKGEYYLEGYFTKANDYGCFDVYLDGKRLNKFTIDGYNSRIINSGKIKLGRARLSQGRHQLKFVLTGKSKSSKGYMIGVDCLVFENVEKEDKVLLVDNRDVASYFTTEGDWIIGSGGQDYAGNVHWAQKGDGRSKAFWRPEFPRSGKYTVYIWYGADPVNDHASNAPFIIKHKKGMDRFTVNLKTNFGKWNPLGEFYFKKGYSGYVMTSNDANGNVLADAVKFVCEDK
ncbi:MAG: DUF2961 domain-containing protein [Candidatus Sumerlaeota bacterium]|nr:DUF2961 domain-containing protein [Candidatus Sumerlaeota bacterium]